MDRSVPEVFHRDGDMGLVMMSFSRHSLGHTCKASDLEAPEHNVQLFPASSWKSGLKAYCYTSGFQDILSLCNRTSHGLVGVGLG